MILNCNCMYFLEELSDIFLITNMATSKRVAVHSNSITKVTECPICLETLKTPKCLPCLHTFCFQCLSKYGADEVDGDKMPCPLCRQEFVIPEEGFEMLQNNFFILQLLSCNTCETETQNSNLACQMCVDEDRDE